MRHILLSMLLSVVISGLIISGCSKNSPNQPEENTAPIDQEYGGFTTNNEPVDEYILTDFESEDEEVVDGISEDAAVQASLDSNSIDIYYVRITWGMLDWDSTATVVTDWSGSASVNKGTLAVLKKIRFERRQGDQVLPRSNRKDVEFNSYTLYHFDGLNFAIIDNDTSQSGVNGEFTIKLGSYSNTFTFAELDSMNLIETVDNTGNQVSIISRKKEVVPFAGGFLEGRWDQETDNGGRFWGRWIHSNGLYAGYLKGIWGINRRGAQVFYGKYLTGDGGFKGLLAGTWGITNEIEGKGWFQGAWMNANFNQIGTLHGSFKTRNNNKGFFRGRWKSFP